MPRSTDSPALVVAFAIALLPCLAAGAQNQIRSSAGEEFLRPFSIGAYAEAKGEFESGMTDSVLSSYLEDGVAGSLGFDVCLTALSDEDPAFAGFYAAALGEYDAILRWGEYSMRNAESEKIEISLLRHAFFLGGEAGVILRQRVAKLVSLSSSKTMGYVYGAPLKLGFGGGWAISPGFGASAFMDRTMAGYFLQARVVFPLQRASAFTATLRYSPRFNDLLVFHKIQVGMGIEFKAL
jgi:hypothetical protein